MNGEDVLQTKRSYSPRIVIALSVLITVYTVKRILQVFVCDDPECLKPVKYPAPT